MRIELDESKVAQVSGGAFNFYEDGTCMVDGIGTYTVSSDAEEWYLGYYLTHKNASAEDIIKAGISAGKFFK